ncbi:hypothetical protein [Chryseobacterium binzhouense]|uniref:hypothetical protein n=1 Tax=Chryseobacterium binzhouense TaxID=2593646 RepID=UPI00289815E9|nr:hypothetical protein [Chryseobacterium binzhouense]
MKIQLLNFSFILIIPLFINSCVKKTEFDSFRYQSGGFGIEDYNFIVNNDSTFTLKVGINLLSNDSANIGIYRGKVNSEQMEHIQRAVSKITQKGYDYHDPEFTLDAGNYEIGINLSNSIKVYKTDNATENFNIDLINPINKICEEISTRK